MLHVLNMSLLINIIREGSKGNEDDDVDGSDKELNILVIVE